MIYLGNGKVANSITAGIAISDVDFTTQNKWNGYGFVARITEETANSINSDNCNKLFNGVTGATDDYGLYYGTTQGRYTGTYSAGDWLFDKIAGFFDYLVGVLTYILRIPLLGWTNIVEVMVNDFIDEISGANEVEQQEQQEQMEEKQKKEQEEEEKLYKPTATDKWERINIEDIIYNHIPILDVNFFSFDEAAGEELQEGSIIYTIRENVA